MSKTEFLPLPLRILGRKSTNRVRGFAADFLRKVPRYAEASGIPKGRVRSVKDWVRRFEVRTKWGPKRSRGPWYKVVIPALLNIPIEPKRVGSSEPPGERPSTYFGEHFNYWDVRTGYDAANRGFYSKPLENHSECFLSYIPNGRLLGPNGAVFTSDSQLLEESLWTWNGFPEKDPSLASLALQTPELISGPVYTIVSQESEGFPHWLTETLPRLYALTKLPKDLRLKIVIGRDLNKWQLESLQLLGFADYERICLENRFLQLEDLFFPSYVGMPGTPHPIAIKWLRDTILSGHKSGERGKRIYISRKLASRRRVLNEDELAPILEKFGFTSIQAETIPFAEQVSLFSEAEAVVALHGAGLANLLWVREGCTVFEILEKTHMSDYYYNLSSALNLNYYYDICEPDYSLSGSNISQGCADVMVDAARFEKHLRTIFGNDVL